MFVMPAHKSGTAGQTVNPIPEHMITARSYKPAHGGYPDAHKAMDDTAGIHEMPTSVTPEDRQVLKLVGMRTKSFSAQLMDNDFAKHVQEHGE